MKQKNKSLWGLIKENKIKSFVIVIGVLFFVTAVTGGIVYGKLHEYYQQSNYVADEEPKTEKIIEEIYEEPEDEELREIHEQMAKYSSGEPITTAGNVYNILLVGIDKVKVREDNGANSDSMILVSINYETKEISMISLMRDMYVDIPGVGHRKLNAAYANGGAQLLMETVQENLRVQVDRYIVVAFKDMVNIVDEIGEIYITFTDREAKSANETITSMCKKLKLSDKLDEYLLPSGGTYACNGIRAVAYARIRKVGNADYQRTSRQREVLSKLVSNLKQMDIDDLDRLANKLLPSITHNIPESEYWGLVVRAPEMLGYQIKQDRIPYDNMFQGRNGSLVPFWDETITKLKGTLYSAKITLPATSNNSDEMNTGE